MNRLTASGVSVGGLATRVFPAISAGPSFHVINSTG
jgi:hypothetical protein